jgi:tetratricopeptide (TPR) repeat protein
MIRWLILPAAVLLSGCVQFYAQQANVNDQIDTWVENHQYDRALGTIDAMSPEHQSYSELRQRSGIIEEKRADYIDEQLDLASSHEADADWAEAISVLNTALSNLPNAPELRAQREIYEERRLASIGRSETAILMARARFLLATRTSEEDLLKATPVNFFAQQRYRAYQQELKTSSRELYVVGKQDLYDNDSASAVQALSLSNRLSPNELSQELLSSIQQAQQSERQQARTVEAAVAEQQWPQLEVAFAQRLALNDLTGAKRLLQEMSELNRDRAEPFQQQLDTRIASEAAMLKERGGLLYSQGFLREALDVWEEALILTPEDTELQANAERARTFLTNLDRWAN